MPDEPDKDDDPGDVVEQPASSAAIAAQVAVLNEERMSSISFT
jgi:hypothetical protein